MMVAALLLFSATNTPLALGENWEASAHGPLSPGYQLGQTLHWLTILGSDSLDNQPVLGQANGYPAAHSDNARCNGGSSGLKDTSAVVPFPAESVGDEDGMAFTVPVPTSPGKAALVSPSGTITTSKPTYTWNPVLNSTWYCLRVSDSTGTKIKSWYRASEAVCAGGTGTCSVTPDTALASGSGKWWIETWNSIGLGPWSDGMAFTVNSF